MEDKDTLLQILVDANRLNKALTNKNDFAVLIKNRDIICNLAEYENWVKEIYDSKEIKEFKRVLKFFDEEAAFLKKKQSSKESVIKSYKNSLNKAYFKLLATFKFLLNEIHGYEENIASNRLIEENIILRNLLGWKGELNVSLKTSKFISKHKNKYNKLNQDTIVKTEQWVSNYIKKNGKEPTSIKQLKEFISAQNV
jgi:hypothetical protein